MLSLSEYPDGGLRQNFGVSHQAKEREMRKLLAVSTLGLHFVVRNFNPLVTVLAGTGKKLHLRQFDDRAAIGLLNFSTLTAFTTLMDDAEAIFLSVRTFATEMIDRSQKIPIRHQEKDDGQDNCTGLAFAT